MMSVGLSFFSSPSAPGTPAGQRSSVFGSAAAARLTAERIALTAANCENGFMVVKSQIDERFVAGPAMLPALKPPLNEAATLEEIFPMAVDLSTRHELVGDLVSLPKSRSEWERYKLSDEQVAFYHEQGYLTGVRILTEEQIAKLRAELVEFFDPQHAGHELWYDYHTNESNKPDTVLFHALGAWRTRPSFHDILWHPAFTVAASQLLGGAVRFWHDQLFCKPAKHGGVVAWHQDYSYWTRTKPMAHLTCWVGLDERTRENGCLHYVPRSHLWNLLPITGLAGDMDAIQTVLSPEQKAQF